MNANGSRPEPPDLSHYEENRGKFPLDELAKHWGKHVAFSPDGTRIVASGDITSAWKLLTDAMSPALFAWRR